MKKIGKNVVCIMSGGNNDIQRYEQELMEAAAAPLPEDGDDDDL